MRVTGRKNPRKWGGMFAAVPLTAIVSLTVVRAMWSASLFHQLGNQMQLQGWSAVQEKYIMQPREVATFEASYFFLKLGTVKFVLLGKVMCHGVPSYWIRAFIDSYGGIPFVNFHAVYETCADARTLMCVSTSNDREEGKRWVHTNYLFNYPGKQLTWEESVGGVTTKKVELPLDTTYTDGLSFFYYVREACRTADGKKVTLTIPIVSDTVRSSVELTINEKREPCSVDAFQYPVEAERMSGHINFEGTFGVTGEFVGWISADSAEVPLRADLKVVIGSIDVKLKSISRDHWVPPRAK